MKRWLAGRWAPWIFTSGAALYMLGLHFSALLSLTESLAIALSPREVIAALTRALPEVIGILWPAWLPALIPMRLRTLRRWITLFCLAIAAGLAVSFLVVYALRGEAAMLVFLAFAGCIAVLQYFQLQRLEPLRVDTSLS